MFNVGDHVIRLADGKTYVVTAVQAGADTCDIQLLSDSSVVLHAQPMGGMKIAD